MRIIGPTVYNSLAKNVTEGQAASYLKEVFVVLPKQVDHPTWQARRPSRRT